MMTKKIRLADLSDFDITEYLENDQAIAEYLTVVLEENDADLLAAALNDVARARGITAIAEIAGISREALYLALRPNVCPHSEMMNHVCQALVAKQIVQPLAQC